MATSKSRVLKNKKILITAGPTWVSIDKVRVISNIASGETGVILAKELARSGASVTLLLGPAVACCLDKNIKLIRFKFFDELKNAVTRELSSGSYDAMIHAAAVSDYRPQRPCAGKVSSHKKSWKLTLVPALKIIGLIKKIDASIFLVGFKFEPEGGKGLLVKRARGLIRRCGLELAVANSFKNNRYCAYIVSADSASGPLKDKTSMSRKLASEIKQNLRKK